MRLGVDLMGADLSPDHLFSALLEALNSLSTQDQIYAIVESSLFDRFSVLLEKQSIKNIFLLSASESIDSEDLPLKILREKKQTTLDLGLEFLREHKIDAMLSMANTAAFLAKARYVLPRLRFVERPGLMAFVPSISGPIAVVDLGANLECSSKTLLSYAIYASQFQSLLNKRPQQKVGLLNVGREAHKGSQQMQELHEVFRKFCKDQKNLQFFGNCEPIDIFQGQVDIVLCNAFIGNIFLKTAEAFSSFLSQKIGQVIPAFEEVPVAQFIGFDSYLFKCHGNASISDLKRAILYIKHVVEKDFLHLIKMQLL